ncbi:hypothetical protein HPS54_04865 [Prevotella sp. PCHR]|uniref:Uncharacterized protein n=2 Tax=Xylanibacter caecicola TaxID=2736294 RepID=A0ABX2B079_9BACT|nr:hypothetical protein [Xylanibacter caecicola]NPE24852.1 hypothetical protein [Xylanibacter caecicola]
MATEKVKKYANNGTFIKYIPRLYVCISEWRLLNTISHKTGQSTDRFDIAYMRYTSLNICHVGDIEFMNINKIKAMKKIIVRSIVTVICGTAVIAMLIWLVMLLWNAIVPELTGWEEIDFWQCAGLCVLFRLITGHIGVSFGTDDKSEAGCEDGFENDGSMEKPWNKVTRKSKKFWKDCEVDVILETNDNVESKK